MNLYIRIVSKVGRASVRLILLSLSMLACGKHGSLEHIPYSVQLKLSSAIIFDIDDSTSFESNYLQVSTLNDEEVLLTQSKHKNSIQYYSINMGTIVKELKFAKEGPARVNEIHGFALISEDSILVFDKMLPGALLVDSAGNLLDRIEVSTEMFLNHASMTRLPDIVIDHMLCMYIFPTSRAGLFDGSVRFEWTFDLQDHSAEWLDFSWPDLYRGKRWTFFHTYPSRVKGEGNFLVYSFGADPSLWVLDLQGTATSYEAKSDFFSDIVPFTGQDETRAFLETGVYGMIMYDGYRNVYYRIAGLPTKPIAPDGSAKDANYKRYSVIILNRQFEKIGETPLEPIENFLIKDWFVCQKGLCISKANYINKDIDEDKMEFNLLVLDTIQ